MWSNYARHPVNKTSDFVAAKIIYQLLSYIFAKKYMP